MTTISFRRTALIILIIFVDMARADLDRQPVVVMLSHEYDFKEIDAHRGRTTFLEFSALVDWLDNQPDVRLRSIRQVSSLP